MQTLEKGRRARFVLIALGFVAICACFAASFGSAALAAGQSVWIQQTASAAAPTPTSSSAPATVVGAFGATVVVNGDTVFIGAPLTSFDDNTQQGAVYVFSETSQHTWEQTAVLKASNGAAYEQFGAAIAVSGSTLIVGAPNASVNGNLAQGAVYIFNLDAGVWTQAQKLVASDGAAGDEFGGAVALDGTHALIGARHGTVAGNAQQGAVYAFELVTGSWSQVQKLLPADGGANDLFGTAIALQGSTALIGAPGANVGGAPLRGAAYAFNYAGALWSQGQKLVASDGIAGDLFGTAVALDGPAALIGAPQATVAGKVNQGKVYAFDQSGTSWSQSGILTSEDGATNDQFGTAIALIGAQAMIGTKSALGLSYLFEENSGVWAQTVLFTDGQNAGSAVDLQPQLAVVGKPSNRGGAILLYIKGNLSLSINAPAKVDPDALVSVDAFLTNNAATSTPPLEIFTFAPDAATTITAVPSQGTCNTTTGILCTFGVIAGNGGSAKAHIEYKLTKAAAATTLTQSVVVLQVNPALTQSVDIRVNGNPQNDGGGGALGLWLLAALALLSIGVASLRRPVRGR